MSQYVGSAWRSRFLRAPKVALKFAERADFVRVGELATVSLGLKTGADKFFFVYRAPVPASQPELKVSPRGGLFVRGYEDWQGWLHKSDALPALVGPHELFQGDRRRFKVPKRTERLYLYPTSGRTRADLRDYVRLGEIGGLNLQRLVAQNAGLDWWRQARPLVRDAWALPYNSAYDYGAWDNSDGAVLNGRFVGVTPHPNVSSDLLGAALNSTFAVAGRLLEGMATGTEGAFDVGPPAVRLIRIPDVRTFSPDAAQSVAKALATIRQQDTMPPAPDSEGKVSASRRMLDTALLLGLGHTPGEAASLLEELYLSYGRWRKDVEDVERQMQQNRRQMSRTGQTRSARPTDVAGRRVWEELSHRARLFPSQLLLPDDPTVVVRLPKGAPLPAQAPLFEPGLITNGTERVDLEHHARVRYAAMLAKLGFEGELAILADVTKAGAIADRFDEDERELRQEAARRAAAYVGRDLIGTVVEVALSHWHQACRKAGMVAAAADEPPMNAPNVSAPLSTQSLH